MCGHYSHSSARTSSFDETRQTRGSRGAWRWRRYPRPRSWNAPLFRARDGYARTNRATGRQILANGAANDGRCRHLLDRYEVDCNCYLRLGWRCCDARPYASPEFGIVSCLAWLTHDGTSEGRRLKHRLTDLYEVPMRQCSQKPP